MVETPNDRQRRTLNSTLHALSSETRTSFRATESDASDSVGQLPLPDQTRATPDRARPFTRLAAMATPTGRRTPGASTQVSRSASAPPDYVPSIAPARLQRTMHHLAWPVAEDEFRPLPVLPPEVVETRRREKECSACCLKCIVVVTTLRWIFVFIALLGAACVVAGIVFGVMSSIADKNTFFVLAFTFIGLGIVLVLVVGIGWRCAPVGHEPCHTLCHLNQPSSDGGFDHREHGTMRAHRMMHRSRNQWYGGWLYPEFRYGTPPPSYSTSMQQYRQMQVQMEGSADRSIFGNSSIISLDNVSSLPNSPPPSYCSRVVGRRGPSISAVVNIITPDPDDQPPPYRSNSTPSSLDGLDENPGSCGGLVSPCPDPAVHDSEETRTADVSTESLSHSNFLQEAPESAEFNTDPAGKEVITECSTHLPEAVLENVPSVNAIVRCFENMSRFTQRKLDVGHERFKTTVQSIGDDCQPSTSFNQSSLENVANRSVKIDTNYQLRSKSGDLSAVSQSAVTLIHSDQSHVADNHSNLLSESSDVLSNSQQCDTRIINMCSVSHTTDILPCVDQSRTRIAPPSVNDSSLANQSLETLHSGVIGFSETSQSPARDDDVIRFTGHSQIDGNFQFSSAANQHLPSDRRNRSYHDFSRSQSLDDIEVGESGI